MPLRPDRHLGWALRRIAVVAVIALVSVLSSSTLGANPEPSSSLPILYRAYLEWDERRNKSISDPLKIVQMTGELAGIRQVSQNEIDADAAIWFSKVQPEALSPTRLTYGVSGRLAISGTIVAAGRGRAGAAAALVASIRSTSCAISLAISVMW